MEKETKASLCIPMVPGEDKVVECCLNGVNYTILRGKTVLVPLAVKRLLKQCGLLQGGA